MSISKSILVNMTGNLHFKVRVIAVLLISAMAGCGFISCSKEEQKPDFTPGGRFESSMLHQYFTPLPHYDTSHWTPADRAKVIMGKNLFYDGRLSASKKISCATCHDIQHYGTDGLVTSVGHKGLHGRRNAPSVLNAALQFGQFWDARVRTIEEQWTGPLMSEREMGTKDTTALLRFLQQDSVYGPFFRQYYGHKTLTLEDVGEVIGAFERILLTPSKWDTFLRGEAALSQEENRGLRLFIQWKCVRCHSGTLLGGDRASRFPGERPYWEYTHSDSYDAGRYLVTGNPADKLAFKVPSLRNVFETAPYFHDGSVPALEDAIKLMANASGYHPKKHQIMAMIAFLKTLTGTLPSYKWMELDNRKDIMDATE